MANWWSEDLPCWWQHEWSCVLLSLNQKADAFDCDVQAFTWVPWNDARLQHYWEGGYVNARLYEYMLEEAPDDMDGSVMMPAGSHLFSVNSAAEHLDKDALEVFHSTNTKTPFLCKQGRPYVKIPIAFLCTRVQAPDVDNSLVQEAASVICYLQETTW